MAINYKTQNISQCLANESIHCYFDNVGGGISDQVVENMSSNGHIILCGQISQYNKNVPYPPPLSKIMEKNLKDKKITRDRFLVLNYASEFEESLKQVNNGYLIFSLSLSLLHFSTQQFVKTFHMVIKVRFT